MAAHNLPASLIHLLPAVCDFGKHEPAIVSRTGGNRDVRRFNACGKCGRQIERMLPDGSNGFQWWGTAEQVAAVVSEEVAEHNAEYEAEMYEAMHPEDRCPPRE
jgi:hypothetical protein